MRTLALPGQRQMDQGQQLAVDIDAVEVGHQALTVHGFPHL